MSTRRFFPPSGVIALTMMARAVLKPSVLGATAIAQDGEGRVLLVRQSYAAGWRLPGGGVNRGEPPEAAVVRELEEEVGLAESTAPEFLGLYSRKVAWFTNVIALYRLRNVRIQFRPNLEVREVLFCDPSAPPDGTAPGTLRRLAELTGKAPRASFW